MDASAPGAVYKALLREMVDRRPSGTRQKIAVAIGKHKSFVSQITNPAYSMPVPARHLRPIFELCHFSAEERRRVLEAYQRAHPGRPLPAASPRPGTSTVISISVPVLNDAGRQADMAATIRRFAEELGALARRWDDTNRSTSTAMEKGSAS